MTETKTCPFCAEEVLAAAKKCKHCGGDLNQQQADRSQMAAVILMILVALVVLYLVSSVILQNDGLK